MQARPLDHTNSLMYRDGRGAALARVKAAQARWRECDGTSERDRGDGRFDFDHASLASMVAAAEAYEARATRARRLRAQVAAPDPLTVAKRHYGAARSEWYWLARRVHQSRARILTEAAVRRRRVDLDALLRNRPRAPRDDAAAYRVATDRLILELERMRDLLDPERKSRPDRVA